jgi:hypothetical protein
VETASPAGLEVTGATTSERAFLGVSALLFAASAAVTIGWCGSMSSMGEMPMPGGWTMSMSWMRMPGQTWPGAAASFLGMWIVMMVAMMLPSLVPMLWRYRRAVVAAGEARLGRLTALVGAGYFAVWTALGVVAFPLGAALAAVEMQRPALARAAPIAVGVVVLLAGALQFTPWKARHLDCCRVAPGRGRSLPADAGPPPEVRGRVKAATGVDDAAALMAEDFIQWVIEDRFCGGRPDWERVGALLVDSVAPYEEAKIRILNATHSCIAWAGTLLGYQFIHQGTRDPRIRKMGHDYVTEDVIPCLDRPDHPSPLDLAAYRDTVLERFGNAALADTCQRVVADGFAKLPGFIVPTIRERLARGESIASVAMLPALFLAFLQRWHAGTLTEPYQDQAMDPVVAHAICASADPVLAFASDASLWGDLAGDERLQAALNAATARVQAFIG